MPQPTGSQPTGSQQLQPAQLTSVFPQSPQQTTANNPVPQSTSTGMALFGDNEGQLEWASIFSRGFIFLVHPLLRLCLRLHLSSFLQIAKSPHILVYHLHRHHKFQTTNLQVADPWDFFFSLYVLM